MNTARAAGFGPLLSVAVLVVLAGLPIGRLGGLEVAFTSASLAFWSAAEAARVYFQALLG
jgi:hypothetical protein